MPVIVLSGRSSLPIDPIFEDGGNIQTIGSFLEDSDGFSSDDPIPDAGTTVIIGLGGASFNPGATTTFPGNVIAIIDGGFTIDVLPDVGTIPTPNIVPLPTPPGVSPPGGMPTVGDFDDNGVVPIVASSVVTIDGGFSQSSSVLTVDPILYAAPVGSNAFTTGAVTSGTAPATEVDTVVVRTFDGFAADMVPSQTTSVLS